MNIVSSRKSRSLRAEMHPDRRSLRAAGSLALFLPLGLAFAQELQSIGTLTIAAVGPQPVSVFSAGISYSVPAGSQSAGGAPETATFSTFNVTKLIDVTSPKILVSAASHSIFPQATITLFDQSGSAPLTTYELTNVVVVGAMVKSVQEATSRALVEEVALDYQIIKQSVFTPNGVVVGCWDRARNAGC